MRICNAVYNRPERRVDDESVNIVKAHTELTPDFKDLQSYHKQFDIKQVLTIKAY